MREGRYWTYPALNSSTVQAETELVGAGDVVLIRVGSLPELLRKQRWTPTPALLETIEPGSAEVKVLALELEADGANISDACSVWVRVEERDHAQFVGSITRSTLDRDGFRDGDRVRVPLDGIFDFVVFDDSGAAYLNTERAQFAVGKQILVGVTKREANGDLIGQREYVGRLIYVDAVRGLQLELPDGSHEWLPPDVRPLEEAPRGEYRLRSTGELVEDPDYVCTWTLTRARGTP